MPRITALGGDSATPWALPGELRLRRGGPELHAVHGSPLTVDDLLRAVRCAV